MAQKRFPWAIVATITIGALLLTSCGTTSRGQRLTIEVTTPSSRGNVTDGEILVSGVVSDGSATLTINDLAVPLTSDGAFSSTIPLNYGSNRISLRAEKEGSNPTTRSVTVTRALTLDIDTPESLTEMSGNVVTVSGSISDPTAMITVTGSRVPVDESGRFSVDVPLHYTETLIKVTAYVADDVSATETLTVIRPDA